MTRPTIVTERLRLEPLTTEHTEELVALDADPEVLRYIFGRALRREEVVDTWMPKRTRQDADTRGLGYWVGRADGAFVGWWCLGVDDHDRSAAELGYRLRRDCWGRGYASEGAAALLDHAFRVVCLQRVWGETRVANHGSRRVMERLGMAPEPHLVEDRTRPVDRCGEIVYVIDRDAYLARGSS